MKFLKQNQKRTNMIYLELNDTLNRLYEILSLLQYINNNYLLNNSNCKVKIYIANIISRLSELYFEKKQFIKLN